MKTKFIQRSFAVLLCFSFSSANLMSVYADGSVSSTSANSDNDGDGRLKWQQDMQDAESARTASYVAGGIGLAAGTVLMVAGLSDKNSAGDTNGCSSSGYQVTCDNQQQADAAQSKIDDGNKKILLGAVVAGLGLVFCAVGINRGDRVNELKVEGMRRQFVWDVEFNEKNNPMFVARMLF